jgi:hypothetical protein
MMIGLPKRRNIGFSAIANASRLCPAERPKKSNKPF